jgi:hypothetical protein
VPACHLASAAGDACWAALGYAVVGPMAMRYDRLEQLAARLHKEARDGPFAETEALSALSGCSSADFAAVVSHLGFRALVPRGGGGTVFAPKRRPGRNGRIQANSPTADGGSADTEAGMKASGKAVQRRKERGKTSGDPTSPFAALQTLVGAK